MKSYFLILEEEWKNYFFCLYFWHISLCFKSNYEQQCSLDVEFNSTSNEYPQCILLTDPATPKIGNTWKKCDDEPLALSFTLGIHTSIFTSLHDFNLINSNSKLGVLHEAKNMHLSHVLQALSLCSLPGGT